MRHIKASIVIKPETHCFFFQFAIGMQAESLMWSNLEWEEIEPLGPDGQPLPEFEASQLRESGKLPERAVVDVPMMLALFDNMPAAKENGDKIRGSQFNFVREVIVGALKAAEPYGDSIHISMLSLPIEDQPSEEFSG